MIFCLQEELEFQLPPRTEISGGGDITSTKCLGRWPAKVHVAGEGFPDDSFIPANFVLLNNNQFAVMIIQLNSAQIYTRLETEEICNPATADTENSEEQPGEEEETEKNNKSEGQAGSHQDSQPNLPPPL